MTNSEDELKIKAEFLFNTLKRYDHYIGTSNFKVGLMMSFLATIILGLSIRIILLNSVQTAPGYIYYAGIIFAVITILCSLYVVTQLFRVVFPNTKNESTNRSLIFFGDVSNCNNGAKEYFTSISNVKTENIVEDLATQTYSVAGIIDEKFKLLKFAVNIICYTVVPFLAITLILLIIHGIKF